MKHNFENLDVWQRSMNFVTALYKWTRDFPDDEKFGFISQLRRASISFPSNIAEGCGRGSNKQLDQFLDYAIGSSCEVETQLYIAKKLEYYTNAKDFEHLLNENEIIRKQCMRFKAKINNE